MVLHVKTMTGLQLTIRAFPSDTVLDLEKNFVEQRSDWSGVSAETLRMILGGHCLENDKTLGSYQVVNGDTFHFVLKMGGGKPVILLYPPAPLDATVALELSPQWSFSTLYPKPSTTKFGHPIPDSMPGIACQHWEWSVHASPDGSLRDLSTGREYPYLFWEADSADGTVTECSGLDETKSFCVAGDATGVSLDSALQRLGLSMRERCDMIMITYRLQQLEAWPFNAIYFVDTTSYEKSARLSIVPSPQVTLRVFMAFRGINAYDARLDTAKVDELRAPARKGFVAVEWGGLNLNGNGHD